MWIPCAGRISCRFHAGRSVRLQPGWATNRILHATRDGAYWRLNVHSPEFKKLVDEAKAQIQEIGPAELKQMLDAREDFTLIDVREADEQAKGTIASAVTLPRGILERDIDKVTTDKERKIVLYCGGGFRSALAAVNLQKMGYRNVISLDGGWRGWQELQS